MTQSPSRPPKGYNCGICGEYHSGLPLDIAFKAPFHWEQIPVSMYALLENHKSVGAYQ